MFKVSFKNNFKKVQTFNDKATIVTLTGILCIPSKIWETLPITITDWIWDHPSVDAAWYQSTNLKLTFSGKSVCAKEDKYDAVLGERIAEARAKLRLYKFMHTFCSKLLHYYYDFMYGNAIINTVQESHTNSPKDCLRRTCAKYHTLMVKEAKHFNALLDGV